MAAARGAGVTGVTGVVNSRLALAAAPGDGADAAAGVAIGVRAELIWRTRPGMRGGLSGERGDAEPAELSSSVDADVVASPALAARLSLRGWAVLVSAWRVVVGAVALLLVTDSALATATAGWREGEALGLAATGVVVPVAAEGPCGGQERFGQVFTTDVDPVPSHDGARRLATA